MKGVISIRSTNIGKYRKNKCDVQPSVCGTRKCDCPFKLRDKPIRNGEGWMLKVILNIINMMCLKH